jgi:hypothetical protein
VRRISGKKREKSFFMTGLHQENGQLMLSQKTSNGMAKQKAPAARRAIVEPRGALTYVEAARQSQQRSSWRVFATPSIQ